LPGRLNVTIPDTLNQPDGGETWVSIKPGQWFSLLGRFNHNKNLSGSGLNQMFGVCLFNRGQMLDIFPCDAEGQTILCFAGNIHLVAPCVV